jgi:hypothetical protein
MGSLRSSGSSWRALRRHRFAEQKACGRDNEVDSERELSSINDHARQEASIPRGRAEFGQSDITVPMTFEARTAPWNP